jgi:hypothetical protein
LKISSLINQKTVGLLITFSCICQSLPLSRGLPATSRRLGEAAASTTFHAGDKRSISHYLFRGATAAVAPNRKLAAGILSV